MCCHCWFVIACVCSVNCCGKYRVWALRLLLCRKTTPPLLSVLSRSVWFVWLFRHVTVPGYTVHMWRTHLSCEFLSLSRPCWIELFRKRFVGDIVLRVTGVWCLWSVVSEADTLGIIDCVESIFCGTTPRMKVCWHSLCPCPGTRTVRKGSVQNQKML
jgi:hypothetical protein